MKDETSPIYVNNEGEWWLVTQELWLSICQRASVGEPCHIISLIGKHICKHPSWRKNQRFISEWGVEEFAYEFDRLKRASESYWERRAKEFKRHGDATAAGKGAVDDTRETLHRTVKHAFTARAKGGGARLKISLGFYVEVGRRRAKDERG